jgi:predicted methyltransferase
MKTAIRFTIFGLILLIVASVQAEGTIKSVIAGAVADTTRPADSRARDSARKPAEILIFSGIAEGDKIVEITPGGGYYTALLSRVVGDEGRVYAVDPERIFEFFPQGRDAFSAYIDSDPRKNVSFSSQFLDDIRIPGEVDQVWMVLYYHDTIWTGEDRAAMNRAFYDMLKPGGVYFVVDHHGLPGAGDGITRDLHRMDAATAKAEIEDAGFTLDAISDVLSNPSDPHDDSVFGEERRGKTDRFVWRYVKPN